MPQTRVPLHAPHGVLNHSSPLLLFALIATLAACSDKPTAPTGAEPAGARAAAGGNSGTANSCQKDGWQNLVTASGAPFKNAGDCTSYGARGGALFKLQTITFGALASRTFGDAPFTVSATASSGLAVTFTATGNCTVTPNGSAVALTGAGSCTVTAKQGGNASYLPAPDVPQTFSIAKGSQSVSFSSTVPSPATVGATYTPTASATSGLTAAITIAPTSPGCTMAGGVVSFTAVGSCLVYANQAGNADYNPATQVQQMITVSVPCISNDASLRAAAAAGGTHTFCTQGAVVSLTGGQVMVNKSLTLTAIGSGNATINAQALSRVLYVGASGNLTLNNVTITGGRTSAAEPSNFLGAGIYMLGPVVLNGTSSVTNNTTAAGAGVLNLGSSLTLNDAASVSGNVSSTLGASVLLTGAGVYLQGGSITMTGTSAISGNSGPSIGGGVVMAGGSLSMSGSSTINLNSSSQLGGGVYFAGGSLTLSGLATITNNTSANGGGIYRVDLNAGSFSGITSSNVFSNTPNNCAFASNSSPVPGCQN